MARTKEFDPDAVLQRALELFWRKGYEATSMADLVEHLGIGRASIYATYGSKQELYRKAFDRYLENGVDFAGILSQPGPVLPAVRALVERFADDASQDTDRMGCFAVNTAVELVAHDEVLACKVASNWDSIEATLVSALTRARAQGELPADRDARELARFLLVVLQGMRLVGKASDDPARIRAAAEVALGALR
ncbi:TetR/AcrR family transcriptional regulator [Yinghuangia seranimata]|uniref:TetR/AcrR family transcriptional regulator n=1 Tax=Yinghuangia seranimata TaxID=408067 RepID=UPI00248C5A4A|nr:TetR/AcrR family transcriptional regulator [Yinghuangia seranimata]MDI2132695.1 TetR/AcrR family transcriptional regulator [Yinghuangia seranimata]